MIMRFLILVLVLSAGYFLPVISAADDAGGTAGDVFTKERVTLQAVSGALFSPTFLAEGSRHMQYSMTFARLGYLMNDPSRPWILPRGSLEAIMQAGGGPILEGFAGSYLLEASILFRYNVVYPHWSIIPFFQVGAGLLYNDVYKDRDQNSIGQAVEFTPQGSLGFRYLLSRRWSLDLEGMFHHISNAGMSERNAGINASGGFIGVTCFFADRPGSNK